MLGQVIGLPTLYSISSQLGLSNALQKSKNKLDKSLTLSKIRGIYEVFFKYELGAKLEELSRKDKSIWSKTLVTAMIDDSVFRQWLRGSLEEVSASYGKFFSGQYKSAVYGYDVLLMGLNIEGIFYPFAFEFIKKKATHQSEKRFKVAQKLLKKWGAWCEELQEKGTHLPILQLSVDSGFNDMTLADKAKDVGLAFISVPPKNHHFIYQKEKLQVKKIIDTYFIPAEKAHLEAQKDLPKEKQEAFVLRIRAKYCCKKTAVTLLLFRLEGSNKVTAIYSLDKHIFAKTLRRHWFARTYIEQFFKLLKHTLKIQEARTKSKEGFERKSKQQVQLMQLLSEITALTLQRNSDVVGYC